MRGYCCFKFQGWDLLVRVVKMVILRSCRTASAPSFEATTGVRPECSWCCWLGCCRKRWKHQSFPRPWGWHWGVRHQSVASSEFLNLKSLNFCWLIDVSPEIGFWCLDLSTKRAMQVFSGGTGMDWDGQEFFWSQNRPQPFSFQRRGSNPRLLCFHGSVPWLEFLGWTKTGMVVQELLILLLI